MKNERIIRLVFADRVNALGALCLTNSNHSLVALILIKTFYYLKSLRISCSLYKIAKWKCQAGLI